MSDERSANPDLTKLAQSLMPFTRQLGLELLEGGPERVVARAQWTPERCTTGSVLHGGFLMAVADSVGAACAGFNLPSGALTSTLESKTNFFRAVSEGSIQIASAPIHVGRTTIVIQTDITRLDGKLVSRTTQTQTVIPGK
jgi:1,4-dihydroxy-2-naphthoyl-CoA hydrolase